MLVLQAHEIIQGALVRYSEVDNGKQPPTAVLVHGILGNRRNMQGFARRLVQVGGGLDPCDSFHLCGAAAAAFHGHLLLHTHI